MSGRPGHRGEEDNILRNNSEENIEKLSPIQPAILLQNIDTCFEVRMKSIPAFVGKVRHEEDALN